jgi:hypothetical protein
MRRWFHLSLAILFCGLGAVQSASAQGALGQYTQPQWQSRPPLSPYLNLLRPGTNPAINYYGLVRPQIETGQNLQQLQRQLQVLDTTMLTQGMTTGAPTAGSLLTTGHPVVFQNYGTYYPVVGNRGATRLGGGGVGGLGGGGYGGLGGGYGGLGGAGFPLGLGVISTGR